MRRDGFEGQKLISLPDTVCREHVNKYPALTQVYVTHIGYFPKAVAHYRMRPAGCSDNILFYCTRGKGWYKVGQQHYRLSANQFAIIPATKERLIYGADTQDPWTIYWVHFSGPNLEAFNDSLGIPQYLTPHDIPLNEKGIAIWDNMYQSLEMGYSKENLCNANFALYQLLTTFIFPDRHLQHQPTAEENYVHSTILYLREKLHEKLSVEDLAARLRLSASYFSTLFRKATGMPPIDYFIHLKMQKACQLLFMDNIKVKEVAEAIGYDDPYHFSRLFKKHMHMSPEQFRHANHVYRAAAKVG
jgi:AraC-like DNA-binding protein